MKQETTHANVSVTAPDWPQRAASYGDGVFRTALVFDGQVADLDRQLAKLSADATRLGIQCPPTHVLEEAVVWKIEQCRRGVLKILVARADRGRGYRPLTEECEWTLTLSPLPDYPARHWQDGICLNWSPVLLGIQPMLAGIKHLNRLEQVLASRDWPVGADEMLMCDAQGRVIGGTRSNMFFVIDNILVTPELSLSGVAGMMRDKIIEMTRANALACEIGLVSPDEVRHATECFVSNSLIGIWPVRRIGSREFAAPGQVTQVVRNLLAHAWSGQ